MGIRIEVLQFFDPSNKSLVARIPQEGSTDIKVGAQLVVQENQEAIFYFNGHAQDCFEAGRHAINTENLPILTRLLSIAWEKSPFQGQVYFVGKQAFVDQKWGTRTPIVLRDPDFGMIRLRGFGKYSFHVADSKLLVNSLVGTQNLFSADDVSNYFRDLIVSRLTDVLGTMNIGILDLPGRYDEVAHEIKSKVAQDFAQYGLELLDFFINAITPPEEVQKAIDARCAMGVVGDLNAYMKFQAAASMAKLAERGMPGDATPDVTIDAKTIVLSVAGAAGYKIEESGDVLKITVPVGALRKQIVNVDFGQKDVSGSPVVNFVSICGPFEEKNAASLMESNTTTVHGAFAVKAIGNSPTVVLQTNHFADSLVPLDVSRTLSAIAWQADQAESQMTGTDEN
jgi:membrane protease subunit (stomatin/prohibitin family)